MTGHTHHDVYLCEGTCRSVVSVEEFRGGKTACGTDGCTRNGQPFTPGVRCDHCGRVRTPAEQAAHAQHHRATA